MDRSQDRLDGEEAGQVTGSVELDFYILGMIGGFVIGALVMYWLEG